LASVRLIHIAPELPPTVGGVADYTAILSRRLVEVSDGIVEPVLVHAGKTQAETIEVEFPVVDLSGEQSAGALAETVRELAAETSRRAAVLLEYSGYGYAERGTPLWLARGLDRVCGSNGLPLITMFHEISASGPVWSSAFWLSPVQSWIARRIAQQSEGVASTHSTGLNEIRKWVGEDTSTAVSPAFSNVGEPQQRPDVSEREPWAVIFGGERTKTALYDTYWSETEAALNRWNVERIVDVGPPDAADPDVLSTHVDVRGLRPAQDISELLLRARIGLLHYPAAYATKSGILSAYMAHGVVPVLVEPQPLGGPLKPNTHFVAQFQGDSAQGKRETAKEYIGSNAASWYDENAHSRRAAMTALSLLEKT